MMAVHQAWVGDASGSGGGTTSWGLGLNRWEHDSGLGWYYESVLAAQSAIGASEFISAYCFDGAELGTIVRH